MGSADAPRALHRSELLSAGCRVLPTEEVSGWAKAQGRRMHLESQDSAISAILERAGIPTRRDRHHDQVVIGLVSGEVTASPAWRHIQMIPSVAHLDRGRHLRALEWFAKHHSNGFSLRYGVITSGQTVPLSAGSDALRERLSVLHRRVSSWAFHCRAWGIEVLFRASEIAHSDSESFHPHSNVVYRPIRILSRAEWDAWLSWSRDFLGAIWRDCGAIKDLREVVKYICKPADLITSDNADSAVLTVFHATFRMRMVAAFGSLKVMLADMKSQGLTVKAVVLKGNKRKLVLLKSEKNEDDRDDDPPSDPDAIRENFIVSKPSIPAPSHLPLAESSIVVLGYTEHPRTEAGRRGLGRIRLLMAQARERFELAACSVPLALEAARYHARAIFGDGLAVCLA